jgi:phosphoglycerate kinase
MTKSIDQVDLSGRVALVRVDFNVPLAEEDGRWTVADDTRIRAALPTIQKIIESGGKAVLMSHLGRPSGEVEPRFSLAPVATHLDGLVDAPVRFVPSTVGEVVSEAIAKIPFPGILVLENTRFLPGEKKNDADLAKRLAALCDVYVNDAFGSAHRAHASTVGVADFASEKVMGYLLATEVAYLSQLDESAERPFVAVLGGAKVSDKIGVIEALLARVDRLLIGGAMSYTLLKAKGLSTGQSLVEEDKLELAADLLRTAEDKIVLPVDHVAGESFDNDTETSIVGPGIPDDLMGLDIGPETIERYSEILAGARTVVWNGPMGVFEMSSFANGTYAIAEALAGITARGALTVVGGGDSVAAVQKSGFAQSVSHVSTGGGAMLEFVEGKALPGIIALSQSSDSERD